MQIAFDITGLYIARAGIFYYSLNLLKQLIAQHPEHEYLLLDYAPARGDLPLPVDLVSLYAPHVQPAVIQGPRERKLTRWPRMNFPGGRTVARQVDRLLEEPWAWWIRTRTDRRLQNALARSAVLHASDVTQLAPQNCALVVTVHDLSPILFPDMHTAETRAYFARKLAYIRQHASAVIAVSEHTRRDLLDHMDFAADRVFVVPNGADEQFRPLDDTAAVDGVLHKYKIPGRDYILHVGTLEPRKNLCRLLEAYARLRTYMPDSLPPLVLAGGKGWHYEEIFAAVEHLKLTGQVHFTGYVADDDLPALYNGAILFVYPSLYEGFGIPVLEAMCCGVPVITSSVSSLPEIAGDAAILIDPTDTEALACALADLTGDRVRRQELAAQGLARAQDFSWAKAATMTLDVYRYAAEHSSIAT